MNAAAEKAKTFCLLYMHQAVDTGRTYYIPQGTITEIEERVKKYRIMLLKQHIRDHNNFGCVLLKVLENLMCTCTFISVHVNHTRF
jgi:hypothetical protein